MGLITVGLGGGDGGGLPELSDCLLLVPSAVTARIQEVHITLGHMLCAAIETACGGAQDELPTRSQQNARYCSRDGPRAPVFLSAR